MTKVMTKENLVHNTPFTSTTEALSFILGGNARFTLRSTKTQTRYTYRVRSSKDKKVHFVRLLTDTNNEGSYTYLGMVKHGEFKLTDKSKSSYDSPPVHAFTWTLAHLQRGSLPAALEIWHDGHCGRCGRALTVPSSLASGFGPECITKVHHD